MSNECKNCGYCYADVDEETGKPISNEYCHYTDERFPAPCEYEED